jgi:hypothetical protein
VKNGNQIPSRPIECDFSDGGHFITANNTLLTGTGINFLNQDVGFSRNDYAKGNALFLFDLTPDLSASCDTHWQLKGIGKLCLELRFSAALAETINCIFYAEFGNLIEISKDREVSVDYSC